MISAIRKLIHSQGGIFQAIKKYGLIRFCSLGLAVIHGNITQRFYTSRSSRYSLYDVLFCPRDAYWWTRHASVAELIRKWDCKSILDVGGGGLGIATFINTKDKLLCTLDRVTVSTGKKQSNFIKGDALSLPFKDKCFDVVCSVAVLPQIPRQFRPRFIAEMLRVGKKVCIYSEAVQDDSGKFNGWEWEVKFHSEVMQREHHGGYDKETMAKRRVDLEEITTFLPHNAGCQNGDVFFRYLSLSYRPFGGFLARLKYYFVYRKYDNNPPYKAVVAYS